MQKLHMMDVWNICYLNTVLKIMSGCELVSFDRLILFL